MNGPPLFEGFYLVKVGVPDSSGLVISMAYIMSEDRPLSTDVTDFCHGSTSILILAKIT